MAKNKVEINFVCGSTSELSEVAQWLQDELERDDTLLRFYEDHGKGRVTFGPIDPQDLVPLLLDIVHLLYGETTPVDVTSLNVYRPKR